MKRLILIALLLTGCGCASCRLHVGDIVQTKVDHRIGQIIYHSPGGYYTVRFSPETTSTYYEFEIELKQNLATKEENSQN